MRHETEKFVRSSIASLKARLEEARIRRGLQESAVYDCTLVRFLPSDMQLMIGEINGLLRVAGFLVGHSEPPSTGLTSKDASKKALYDLYGRIYEQLEINTYPWFEKIELTRSGPMPDEPIMDDHYVTTKVMDLAVLNYFANIPELKQE